MKKINKVNYILVVTIVLIMVIASMIIFIPSLVVAEESKRTLDSYTNTDNYIYENKSYEITKYINEKKLDEQYGDKGKYASTIKYTSETSDGSFRLCANGDDPIVEIVPKYLFTSKNTELVHIGLEYGFFVKSEQLQEGVILTNVFLFDISNKTKLDETNDYATFSIIPLFQREYAYIESETGIVNTRAIKSKNESGIEFLEGEGIYINIEKGMKDKVIPLPYFTSSQNYSLSDSYKYYLNDITSVIGVLNEQHLNVGDAGYNPYDDKGRFIIQSDTAYKAKIYSTDKKAVLDPDAGVDVLGMAVLDKGVGMLLESTPILGAAYEAFRVLYDTYEAVYQESELVSEVERKFTYKANPATAQGQIEKSGGLYKTSMLKLQAKDIDTNYGEGSFLYYDIGDNLTCAYQLAYTPVKEGSDDKFKTPWETRLRRGFDLSFTTKNGSQVFSGQSFYEVGIKGDSREYKELVDNEGEKVSILENGENLFKFVAPRSGKYRLNIKNARNKIDINYLNDIRGNIVSDNTSDMVIEFDLKKGDEVKFATTYNDKSNYGIADIKMSYSPYEIGINGSLSFGLFGLDDYSDVISKGLIFDGYHFDFNVAGRVRVDIYESSDLNNKLFSEELNSNNFDENIAKEIVSLICDRDVHIRVVNLVYESSKITINLEKSESVETEKEYILDKKGVYFYKYVPKNNCRFIINMNDKSSVVEVIRSDRTNMKTYIYDNYVSCNLYTQYEYLIKITKSNDGENTISFSEEYKKLQIGSNTIKEDCVMTIGDKSSDFDIIINVQNANVTICDSDNNEIKVGEKFTLIANKKYYVYISNANNAIISVEVEGINSGDNYLNRESFDLNGNGYQIIKFNAKFEGNYSIKGVNGIGYEIYDNMLNNLSENTVLKHGRTYFIKVYGEANKTCSIDINYNGTLLYFTHFNVVQNGVYNLNILKDDTFMFETFNTSFNIDIIGINGESIFSNITINNNIKELDLKAGNYVLQVKDLTTDKYLSIISKFGNVKDDIIQLDKNKSIALDKLSSSVYKFVPNESLEYYLDFGDSVSDSAIKVYYYEGEQIKYVDIKVRESNKKLKLSLDANQTYYFEFYNETNYYMNNNFTLYIPVFINEVSINGNIVISDGKKVNPYAKYDIELVMGFDYIVEYSLQSDSTNKGIKLSSNGFIEINGLIIKVPIDKEILYEELKIETMNSVFIIKVKFVLPYQVKAELVNGNALKVVVDYADNMPSNTKVTNHNIYALVGDNFEITLNNFVQNGNEYLFNFAQVFELNSPSYDIKVNTSIEFDNGVLSYEIITDEKLETNYIDSGSANDSRVYIELNKKENVQITLGENVETLFIKGSGTITNITINGNKSIYIYIDNVEIGIADSPEVAFLSNRQTTNITINGLFSLSGYAENSIMQFNELNLYGNEKFNVVGTNGSNSTSSDSVGADGTDCIVADKISIYSGVIATIKAGNGGNGFDGSNGKDNSAGQNGSAGGNGGIAVNCAIINNDATVSLVFGTGGNGGNGGNGGKVVGNGLNGQNGGIGGDGGNAGGTLISITFANCEVSNGFAGFGGNGGNGTDGTNGTNADITSKLENYTPNYGGHYTIYRTSALAGGNGGNGGNSGKNGEGNVSTSTIPTGGNGGNGANGGKGYIDGMPSYMNSLGIITWVICEEVSMDGGNGGDGGKGYKGGDGGHGGNGADGAHGADAVFLGHSGSNGGDGGDGGHGGDGGDTWDKTDNGGKGGAGGTGGKAGTKGKGMFESYVDGNAGQDGFKGRDGNVEPACITEGTLITLADGRQVPVEKLTGNEQLLVWNMFTGKFESAPILFIDSDPRKLYEVIELSFSDGTTVKVIDEHGFWDFDLNRYVYIRNDASKYIGHYFNKQNTDNNGNISWTKVQLVDVRVYEEYTSAWSPVTYGHLCYYVNGMLSMPGATEGLVNIFEVDPITMTIDKEAYERDIEKYGMFTYEEFASIYPVTEEVFEAFNGKYLKVALGKGILTHDMIAELLESYKEFLE